ncbi:MAG: putative toxin-antitoxin system toxin component, PIN family [Rhizobiales bacterium]|nr:putative toxin-antitoxin system toxin component, PIN family [Hyphomicrobiales bacterium]
MTVVVDTNVFVSAIMSKSGASREVVRWCLKGDIEPLMGNALFNEYEDVAARDELFDVELISRAERGELLDAFFASCRWVAIYYLWRPNLRDEADNHLMELAVAGNASTIITGNKRDFRDSELKFPGIHVQSPAEFLKEGRLKP